MDFRFWRCVKSRSGRPRAHPFDVRAHNRLQARHVPSLCSKKFPSCGCLEQLPIPQAGRAPLTEYWRSPPRGPAFWVCHRRSGSTPAATHVSVQHGWGRLNLGLVEACRKHVPFLSHSFAKLCRSKLGCTNGGVKGHVCGVATSEAREAGLRGWTCGGQI